MTELFHVVVNHEDQFSLWRAGYEQPPGWRRVTEALAESTCLDWVEENWTDIRPLSARNPREPTYVGQDTLSGSTPLSDPLSSGTSNSPGHPGQDRH